MKFQNRIITFLTIAVILYSFYYYNRDGVSRNTYIEDETSGSAKYNLTIDPERSDLSWYEKWIIKRAKKKQQQQEKDKN